jgi:hypothetical protein
MSPTINEKLETLRAKIEHAEKQKDALLYVHHKQMEFHSGKIEGLRLAYDLIIKDM